MPKSIISKRQDIEFYLKRALGDDYIVVSSPDHPLVLKSVDILVGGHSGLTAIMMASAQEMRKPSDFVQRVILNKMALPSHTRFVFMKFPQEQYGKERTSNNFDATLLYKKGEFEDEILSIVKNPDNFISKQSRIEFKKIANERFSNTYRLSRAINREFKRDYNNISREKTSNRLRRDIISNQVDAIFFEGRPSPGTLADISLEGADRWFNLDDGVPYATSRSAGALFTSEVPISRNDPEKYLRAAAFSGWVLVPRSTSQSADRIAELIDHYTRVK